MDKETDEGGNNDGGVDWDGGETEKRDNAQNTHWRMNSGMGGGMG